MAKSNGVRHWNRFLTRILGLRSRHKVLSKMVVFEGNRICIVNDNHSLSTFFITLYALNLMVAQWFYRLCLTMILHGYEVAKVKHIRSLCALRLKFVLQPSEIFSISILYSESKHEISRGLRI